MAPRILIPWIALDGMGSAFALPAEQDQRKAMIAGIDHAPSVLSELGGFEPATSTFVFQDRPTRRDDVRRAMAMPPSAPAGLRCHPHLKCGWGTWIRTKILGVRVRCSTVELFPNIFKALQITGGLFPMPDTCRKGPD